MKHEITIELDNKKLGQNSSLLQHITDFFQSENFKNQFPDGHRWTSKTLRKIEFQLEQYIELFPHVKKQYTVQIISVKTYHSKKRAIQLELTSY